MNGRLTLDEIFLPHIFQNGTKLIGSPMPKKQGLVGFVTCSNVKISENKVKHTFKYVIRLTLYSFIVEKKLAKTLASFFRLKPNFF